MAAVGSRALADRLPAMLSRGDRRHPLHGSHAQAGRPHVRGRRGIAPAAARARGRVRHRGRAAEEPALAVAEPRVVVAGRGAGSGNRTHMVSPPRDFESRASTNSAIPAWINDYSGSVRLSDFDYRLPPELIAQHPAAERTASRLLHLDGGTGALEDLEFPDIARLLDAGDVLVL